jgi:hypothetical protein
VLFLLPEEPLKKENTYELQLSAQNTEEKEEDMHTSSACLYQNQ